MLSVSYMHQHSQIIFQSFFSWFSSQGGSSQLVSALKNVSQESRATISKKEHHTRDTIVLYQAVQPGPGGLGFFLN